MKIAIVSTNEQSTPPPDNVIIASLSISSAIAEGLVNRGHEVYSIVGKGSTIKTFKRYTKSYPFFETVKRSEWENIKDIRLMWQLIMPFEIDLHLTLLDLLKEIDIDIIHFHSIKPYYGLPFAQRTNKPSIFTLHSPAHPMEVEVMKTFTGENIKYVSISDHQRLSYPGIDFSGTVYNGTPINEFIFHESGGKDIVFAGRIKPDKGVKEAIEVAIKTNHKLLLAGDIRTTQLTYYQQIESLINNHQEAVKFLPFMNHSLIGPFFAEGRLSLFPIQWEEPFGLVFTESMATGTPVVAFARGSVPEIIIDGKTGFIVNPSNEDIRGDFIIKETGLEGLIEAVQKIYAMPENEYKQMRKNCRKHVEDNFTSEKMVEGYENLYKKILSAAP